MRRRRESRSLSQVPGKSSEGFNRMVGTCNNAFPQIVRCSKYTTVASSFSLLFCYDCVFLFCQVMEFSLWSLIYIVCTVFYEPHLMYSVGQRKCYYVGRKGFLGRAEFEQNFLPGAEFWAESSAFFWAMLKAENAMKTGRIGQSQVVSSIFFHLHLSTHR